MSENDDFQIELGRSFSRRHESKPSPLKDRSLCAFPYDQPDSDRVPVFIAEKVMRAMEEHVERDTQTEVGGVLLGAFYRHGNDSFVEVTDLIEATDTKSTGVSLTFTHDTWEQISREQSARGAAIVGWYHSHPGLGVFLSKEDKFIHTSYFADPWQVAVVVDPVYHNWGCFNWSEGDLAQSGGFYVFGEKKEAKRVRDYTVGLEGARQMPSAAVTAAGGRTNRSVWAAIIVLLAMQIVIGWMLFAQESAPIAAPDYYTDAVKLLAACDLTGGEQMLRMRLMSDPDDRRASRELQRLSAIMDSPGIESPSYDRVDFLLQRADELAKSEPKPAKRSEFEGIMPGSEKPKMKLEADDPTVEAFKIYESARDTRAARLRRAIAVQNAARKLLGSRVVRRAWWDSAVTWLRNERLREIAYGLHSGQSGYEGILAKLSQADQAAVKKIKMGIGKNR